MVSLGNNNHRSPRGGYFFNSDASPLFDETDEASLVSSVFVSDEEPHFRTIPVTGVIVLEIISTILLLVSAFVVPLYKEEETCFILSCVHSSYWCLLFITSSYRNFHHNHIQRCGYLEFFRNTQLVQKIPLLVISLGNALLVVTLSVFHRFCSSSEKCPKNSPLSCYNYLQIVFGIEVIVSLICLIKYLVLVVKFNQSKAVPDVHQDELLAAYIQSYAPVNEVGFRDEDYMEEILEKQADMIRYLKQHSNSLSRKIMKLSSQLENIQNTAQRF